MVTLQKDSTTSLLENASMNTVGTSIREELIVVQRQRDILESAQAKPDDVKSNASNTSQLVSDAANDFRVT